MYFWDSPPHPPDRKVIFITVRELWDAVGGGGVRVEVRNEMKLNNDLLLKLHSFCPNVVNPNNEQEMVGLAVNCHDFLSLYESDFRHSFWSKDPLI